jgi:hypothetical protein
MIWGVLERKRGRQAGRKEGRKTKQHTPFGILFFIYSSILVI